MTGPDPDEGWSAEFLAKLEEERADILSMSTWMPRDHDEDVIAGIIDGTIQQQAPDIIAFGEGHMLYTGKVHSIAGESGAGKSMFAGQASIEVLEVGGEVYYFDLETTYEDFLLRQYAIGYDFKSLDRFHYAMPEHPVTGVDMEEIVRRIEASHEPVLVVIDSAGEALNLEGKDSNTEDVSEWYRKVAQKMSRAGAAVLLVDHIPKKNGNSSVDFAIGSQRKRAAIDVQFMLDSAKRFSRTQAGHSKIRVTKDRWGYFAAGDVGRMVVSVEDGTRVTFDTVVSAAPTNHDGSKRYTALMESMSVVVEKSESAIAKSNIKSLTSGDNNAKEDMLKLLAEEGYIRLADEARPRKGYVSVKQYREATDPLSSKYVPINEEGMNEL